MVAYFVDACFYQRSRFCVCNIQHFFTTQGTNQDFMCNIQHFLLPKEQIKILCVISNIFETSGFVEERGFHWVHRSPLCCWQTGRFKTCTKVKDGSRQVLSCCPRACATEAMDRQWGVECCDWRRLAIYHWSSCPVDPNSSHDFHPWRLGAPTLLVSPGVGDISW